MQFFLLQTCGSAVRVPNSSKEGGGKRRRRKGRGNGRRKNDRQGKEGKEHRTGQSPGLVVIGAQSQVHGQGCCILGQGVGKEVQHLQSFFLFPVRHKQHTWEGGRERERDRKNGKKGVSTSSTIMCGSWDLRETMFEGNTKTKKQRKRRETSREGCLQGS